MSCRSGCPTGGHVTWGECARAADIQIDNHGLQNRNVEKDKDKRLSAYEDLKRDGIQPKQTTWKHIRHAYEHGGVGA